MHMADKKRDPAVAIVLSGASSSEHKDEETDGDPALMDLAEEAMDALKADDAAAFAEAMKAFFLRCGSSDEEVEEEEAEPETDHQFYR